ncbi:hypothetical protein, partial [Pseudomonas rhizophila]|uniref:hypothetical protein n=1 Tax=Pseudomonas rhizophila TaxID=2045200 RepID=UPI0030DCF0F6
WRTHLLKSSIKGDVVRVFLADAITLIARISMRQRSSYPKPFKAQVNEPHERQDTVSPLR